MTVGAPARITYKAQATMISSYIELHQGRQAIYFGKARNDRGLVSLDFKARVTLSGEYTKTDATAYFDPAEPQDIIVIIAGWCQEKTRKNCVRRRP
jgi:hypothetical protein